LEHELAVDGSQIQQFLMLDREESRSTLFPYTPLFRSSTGRRRSSWLPKPSVSSRANVRRRTFARRSRRHLHLRACSKASAPEERSEEHTSELQSRFDLVCRLLLEKKKR